MGYFRHHAIVVTTWADELIEAAHAKAVELDAHPTPITDDRINGFRSFLIPPDGSKEGWPDSDLGDERRQAWVAWANEQRYEDGSSALHWVEVEFGGDGGPAIIVTSTHDWPFVTVGDD